MIDRLSDLHLEIEHIIRQRLIDTQNRHAIGVNRLRP